MLTVLLATPIKKGNPNNRVAAIIRAGTMRLHPRALVTGKKTNFTTSTYSCVLGRGQLFNTQSAQKEEAQPQ